MAPGRQRRFRAFFRALAIILALGGTLFAVHERAEAVVIPGPPAGAAASLEYTRTPMPAARSGQPQRRRIVSTNASATRPTRRVLHSGRPVRLHLPARYSTRPPIPVYLAYLRVLC